MTVCGGSGEMQYSADDDASVTATIILLDGDDNATETKWLEDCDDEDVSTESSDS